MPALPPTISATVRNYGEIVFRRKWLVIIPTVLGLATSMVISFMQPKIYRSQAILSILDEFPADVQGLPRVSSVPARISRLSSEVKRRHYLRSLAEEFRLVPAHATPEELDDALEELTRSIQIDCSGDRLYLVCTHSRPDLCKLVADKLLEKFQLENQSWTSRRLIMALNFLQSEQEYYKERVIEAKKNLSAYIAQTRDVLTPEMVRTLILLKLLGGGTTMDSLMSGGGSSAESMPEGKGRGTSPEGGSSSAAAGRGMDMRPSVNFTMEGGGGLAEQVFALEMEKAVADMDIDSLQRALDGTQRTIVHERVVETPEYQRLKAKEDEVIKEINELKTSGTLDTHPFMVKAKQKLDNVRVLLEQERARLPRDRVEEINPRYAELEQKLKERKHALDIVKLRIVSCQQHQALKDAQIVKLPEVAIKLSELQHVVSIYDGMRSSLYTQQIRIEAQKRSEEDLRNAAFRLEDHPKLPITPYAPAKQKIALTGALVGLIIGVALMILAEMTDHSFQDVQQLQMALGVPVLGSISVMLTQEEKRLLRAKHRLIIVSIVLFVVFVVLGLLIKQLSAL